MFTNRTIYHIYQKQISYLNLPLELRVGDANFTAHLVDKFIIFYFPIIVGGKNTPTIVDGDDSFYPNLIRMKLKESKRLVGVIMNTYENEK